VPRRAGGDLIVLQEPAPLGLQAIGICIDIVAGADSSDRRPAVPKWNLPIVGRRRVLQGTALVGAAVLTPSLAANSQNAPMVTPMSGELTADEIRTLLKLEPNATCGFVRVTFVSKQSIAAGGLPAPFAEGRPLGSALYFMVTPGAPVRLHRIRNDQLYHYYLGDPLEVFLLHADATTERIIVGPDLRSGQRVQLLIPGNTFHTARLIGRRRWFLGASTEWPSVVPADVEIGNLDELAGKYPAVAADLRAIAASVQHVAPSGVGPR
jgi:predicted cupin superfamily sugar epimerase